MAAEGLSQQFKRRLTQLGYATPRSDELKREIRKVTSYQAEWSQVREEQAAASSETVIRFIAQGPDGRYAGQPEKQGLYDCLAKEPVQLSNFSLFLDEDLQVDDDLEPRRRFQGRVELLGREMPFSIDAEDYGNNNKLAAAIYGAAGAKAEWYLSLERLRTAISAISHPEVRRVSTNFGWNVDRTAYLVKSGRITASGFQAATASDGQGIDLSSAEFARKLDLWQLEPAQLEGVKRHVVEDLLQLCPDRKVGYSLLGALALSVLYRFTDVSASQNHP